MALNNPDSITKILRESQNIDQTLFNQIIKCSEGKPIHLFEIGKLTKLLLLGSRYQVIFYTVFGLAYMSLIGKEKYEKLQDDLGKVNTSEKYYEIKQERIQSKMTKIKVVSVLFGLTSLLGLKLTFNMGKQIPKSIWLLPHNQLQITFYTCFGRKKNIVAPITEFSHFTQNSKLNRTVMMQYKQQKLSTIGTGISHSNLIKYLIMQNVK